MLSLYIHIPFCVRKCHYCGFYSTVYSEEAAERYLSGLEWEIQGHAAALNGRTFRSVYIGGGTPTTLSPAQLDRLHRLVTGSLSVSRDAEFTIEANPNSLSTDLLSLYRRLDINRLSMGIQSFSDELLVFLGRLHTGKEAIDAYERARRSGFGNIGIDLIYGVPGLTEREWKKTIETAAALKPEHISIYSLSLDEGSRFRQEADQGGFSLPAEESVAGQYESALQNLVEAGYEQYEISNFSLPGFACRHNLNYWKRGEYLGLGPGAWSFIGGRRWRTVPDLKAYAEGANKGRLDIESEETIDPGQAANEKVMLALRTSRGLDLEQYGREFGAESVSGLKERSAGFEQSGLVVSTGGRLRLTKKGFLLSNEVLSALIS